MTASKLDCHVYEFEFIGSGPRLGPYPTAACVSATEGGFLLFVETEAGDGSA